jgi:hypothetical protein
MVMKSNKCAGQLQGASREEGKGKGIRSRMKRFKGQRCSKLAEESGV